MAPRIKLGELLVRAGVLDEGKLNVALSEQQRWGGKLGKILVDMNFVSEEILIKALSKQLAVPVAMLDAFDVPQGILNKIDIQFARQQQLCPIAIHKDGRTLLVAMADPINVSAIDEISHRTGYRVQASIAPESRLSAAISHVYGTESSALMDQNYSQVLLDNSGSAYEPSRPPAPLDMRATSPTSTRPPQMMSSAPPSAVNDDMLDALDAAQKKQLKAIRAMVDLLIDKGVFSREEYLSRLNRR